MQLIKWIPNVLTMARFIGLFVGTWFLFQKNEVNAYLAFFIYFLISITDVVDGYIARRFNAVTAFGKIMDPIADKAYILTLYLSFAFLGRISFWWTAPILFREVAVTVSRMLLLRQNRVVAAGKSGKLKTLIQNISLGFLFLEYFQALYWKVNFFWFSHALVFFMYFFLVLATFLTISSGFDFFISNYSRKAE